MIYIPSQIRPCPACEVFAIATLPIWLPLILLAFVGACLLRGMFSFERAAR